MLAAVPLVLWYFEVIREGSTASLLMFVSALVAAGLAYKAGTVGENWLSGAFVLAWSSLLLLFSFSFLGVEPASQIRVITNESRAAETLLILARANAAYSRQKNRYVSTLAELDTSETMSASSQIGLLQDAINKGLASGYVFEYQRTDTGFELTAAPRKVRKTGNLFFYVDQELKVRHDYTKAATSQTPLAN